MTLIKNYNTWLNEAAEATPATSATTPVAPPQKITQEGILAQGIKSIVTTSAPVKAGVADINTATVQVQIAEVFAIYKKTGANWIASDATQAANLVAKIATYAKSPTLMKGAQISLSQLISNTFVQSKFPEWKPSPNNYQNAASLDRLAVESPTTTTQPFRAYPIALAGASAFSLNLAAVKKIDGDKKAIQVSSVLPASVTPAETGATPIELPIRDTNGKYQFNTAEELTKAIVYSLRTSNDVKAKADYLNTNNSEAQLLLLIKPIFDKALTS